MMPQFTRTRERTERAQRLRRDMTPMEKKLWFRLREAKLGVSFRRQHPVGPFIVDFIATSIGLVVELDGGQHGTEAGLAADAARTRFLESKGLTVLRFGNSEMFENGDGVVEMIWLKVQAILASAGLTPTPTLPLSGRGGDLSHDNSTTATLEE
jgi:very-short-patch-repair endonuclease